MNRFPRELCLLLALGAAVTLAPAAEPEPEPGPRPPEAERASFQLADPDLVVELIAAEPDVVSPVAVAWDAHGRLYVAEMSDYPNAPDKGRIRRLEDRDLDGRYERVTVFADRLPFPNGVLPWKDGVLVTAAPDIWLLADRDGDGVAEERRRVLTGFAEGNQQLRVNGLAWGLHGWIYGANGRSDGGVRWVDASGTASGQEVLLRGHDFRFRPDTLEFELLAGRSQFGLGLDDWGNRFLSWNTIPLRHEVIPERHLARVAVAGPVEACRDILEPGDQGRVYPLTPPPLTFNRESTSHFNALCGLTVFRGDALGERYRGNAFVGESLRNLIHRRVLEPAGATFVARRGDNEREREFLASTDPWFHPVNFATGPEGALYVVDFYRRFVEHPDFVQPASVRAKVAWRTGAEHGRLWRIRHRAVAAEVAARAGRLAALSGAELVRAIERTNGWQRDAARRLLAARPGEPGVRTALTALATAAAAPEARLGALAALRERHELLAVTLRAAWRDPDARVRAGALDSGLHVPGVEAAGREEWERLVQDVDGRVRLRAALTLGHLPAGSRARWLAVLMADGAADEWVRLAVLSSVAGVEAAFLEALRRAPGSWLYEPSPDQARFLERVTAVAGAGDSGPEPVSEWWRDHALPPGLASFSLCAGLMEGLARSGRTWPGVPRSPPEAWRPLVVEAGGWATNGARPLAARQAALRVAVQARAAGAEDVVRRLVRADQPAELQVSAARAVVELGEESLMAAILAEWSTLSVATRRHLIAGATRAPGTTRALVTALEQGVVARVEVDAATRQALQKAAEAGMKARVDRLWVASDAVGREEVLRRFEPAVRMVGDRTAGASLFARLCQGCHAVQGRGAMVGPDLSGLGSRPAETVLVDILDPNRQVPPEFIAYTCVTTGGETVTGLLVSETPGAVVIRRQGQPDEILGRGQIREMRAEGASLMPEGLEQGLTPADIAGLLEFLRRPEASLLPR